MSAASRVRPGVPSGGQFAAVPRAEADVELHSEKPDRAAITLDEWADLAHDCTPAKGLPRKHGVPLRADYMPERLDEYVAVGVVEFDPRTLVATQSWQKSTPDIRKALPGFGRSGRPPEVYLDPDLGEVLIGDGHHRTWAHAKAGRKVRCTLLVRPMSAYLDAASRLETTSAPHSYRT